MPEIPQAASYNQLGQGLQLGLGIQAAQLGQAHLAEQQRHAQTEEAIQQGAAQIQQQEAQRAAQTFAQQQMAQAKFRSNLAEEQDNDPDAEPTVHVRRALARTLPEYPGAQIPTLLNATEMGAYREGIVNARQQNADTMAERNRLRAEEAEKKLAELAKEHADKMKALQDRLEETTRMHDLRYGTGKDGEPTDFKAHRILDEEGNLVGHYFNGQIIKPERAPKAAATDPVAAALGLTNSKTNNPAGTKYGRFREITVTPPPAAKAAPPPQPEEEQ